MKSCDIICVFFIFLGCINVTSLMRLHNIIWVFLNIKYDGQFDAEWDDVTSLIVFICDVSHGVSHWSNSFRCCAIDFAYLENYDLSSFLIGQRGGYCKMCQWQ